MRLFLLQGRGTCRYFLEMRFAKVGLFLFFSVFVAIADPGGNWQEVRALYDSGKLEEAFQALQKTQGARLDAIHYYNLGTIAFHLGRVGQSVAYLEKARKLSSGDPDIHKNLQTARTALSRMLGSDRLDPGATVSDELVDRMGSKDLQALWGMASLAVLLLGFRLYLKSRKATGSADAAAIGLLSAGALLFFLLVASTQFSRIIGAHPAAVALSRQVIRSGPGEQFQELTQVEPGTKVRLTGNSITGSATSAVSAPPVSDLTPMAGSASPTPTSEVLWHQVRYSGDQVGWMKGSEFLFL